MVALAVALVEELVVITILLRACRLIVRSVLRDQDLLEVVVEAPNSYTTHILELASRSLQYSHQG